MKMHRETHLVLGEVRKMAERMEAAERANADATVALQLLLEYSEIHDQMAWDAEILERAQGSFYTSEIRRVLALLSSS